MVEYLLRRVERVISAQFDDGLALLDTEQGAYFSLNETAAEIWRLLETPTTAIGLQNDIQNIYDVSPERCAEQVELTLAQLKLHALIIEE